MGQFRMKVAGAVGQVECLFDSTRDYCRDYLSEEAADFRVQVRREDLEFEQQALLEEARAEGFRPRVFTDPFLERAAIQRAFANYLLDRGTVLFHGSAIAVDGRGYLFTAPSGTGKSTHTRLWHQLLGQRAVTVNDDKPFIRIEETQARLCGAPWSGKHGLQANVEVPLRGICLLTRGTENRIRPMAAEEALPMLRRACETGAHFMEQLAGHTRLWQLECTPDIRAAEVAFAAMHK